MTMRNGRATALLLVMLAGLSSPQRSVAAKLSPAARCTASKAGATGAALGGALGCHAKARAKATTVDGPCIDKTRTTLTRAFSTAGTACPGDAPAVQEGIDACVAALTAAVTGAGKCPRRALAAFGGAAHGVFTCAAKDARHPGKGGACRTATFSRLDKTLSRVAACAAGTSRTTLETCTDAIALALAGATTTTSTTTTTTTLPAFCQDADGDGISDPIDLCAGTPAGVLVDTAGCSKPQFCARVDASARGKSRGAVGATAISDRASSAQLHRAG